MAKIVPIKRLLIANRGEIALRIIRTAKELGIETVAVYADSDAQSQHRFQADYAIRLAGNTSAETYLNIPVLIEAMQLAGIDAVHPGYGFLSENADFVAAVVKAGFRFVGPPEQAMRTMGDKVAAKHLMRQHEVPIVPGSQDALKSEQELRDLAKKMGFPFILKASAGGGGRGMRIVKKEQDIADAYAGASREALSYFGNPAVFAERYIENPRHIEIQVLCDAHGNGVHLFERDCSVQRRHQKLIEEAPSTYLNHEQRMRLGSFAVKAALASGYVGVGTVEFISATPDETYFMEMNTRIQVEHPVTEWITGFDLVAEQLRVAQGIPLSVKQEDIHINGWSIEARINAEDPLLNFAPAPGKITDLILPGGAYVRNDTHAYPGYEIPAWFDSMFAKLIVWGKNRDEAIQRMLRALAELKVEGVPTTARFHQAVMQHPKFRAGDFRTSFVEHYWPELLQYMSGGEVPVSHEQALALALTAQPPQAENTGSDRLAWAQASRLEQIKRS